MLIAAALLELGWTGRALWLYDTFEGMSEPSDRDVDVNGFQVAEEWVDGVGVANELIQARSPLNEVRNNMASVGYPEESSFRKGKGRGHDPREAVR